MQYHNKQSIERSQRTNCNLSFLHCFLRPSFPEDPLLTELARSGSDLFSTNEDDPSFPEDLSEVDLGEVVVEMEISGVPVDSSSHSGGVATGAPLIYSSTTTGCIIAATCSHTAIRGPCFAAVGTQSYDVYQQVQVADQHHVELLIRCQPI